MKAEPVCNVRIQMSKDQAESLADDLQRLFEDPDFDIDFITLLLTTATK